MALKTGREYLESVEALSLEAHVMGAWYFIVACVMFQNIMDQHCQNPSEIFTKRTLSYRSRF